MKLSSNIMKHLETLEHSPFDAMILAVEAETSELGVAISVLAWSFWQYRCLRGVSGDIAADFPVILAIAELV